MRALSDSREFLPEVASLERSGVRDRLPELYRDRGGEFLNRYLRVAEELLAWIEDRRAELPVDLHTVVGRLFGHGEASSQPGADVPSLAGAHQLGTVEGLADWAQSVRDKARSRSSRRRSGSDDQPWVWPTLTASQDSDGHLVFSRTWMRTVILAWSPGGMARPLDDLDLPTELFPAGCEVLAVWLKRAPRWNPPLPGSRLAGRILRASSGGDAAPSAERL